MSTETRRSPLALALLVLLWEEPMHPYRMQQLIKHRQKDAVINVRLRSSLYQTIDRLLRAGLIAVQETEKAENRPERTVYRLTEAGAATARAWMHDMLANPINEFPQFPAALAHLALLTPEEALTDLQQRLQRLHEEIAVGKARMIEADTYGVPRLFLLEDEYSRALLAAEQTWLQGVIADLASGRLTWDAIWLDSQRAAFGNDAPEQEEEPVMP